LVTSECGVTVENRGVTFWCEAVFVGVAAYACHAFQSEVEELGLETGFFKERYEEGAKTAVYV
jgi:hypothetical protein